MFLMIHVCCDIFLTYLSAYVNLIAGDLAKIEHLYNEYLGCYQRLRFCFRKILKSFKEISEKNSRHKFSDSAFEATLLEKNLQLNKQFAFTTRRRFKIGSYVMREEG
jgi:hypothetical protein